MNRVEFMKELRAGIVKLPYQEAEAALEYYEEYFEEAGPKNEERVIEELGDPKEVAAQIMRDFRNKEAEAGNTFDEKEVASSYDFTSSTTGFNINDIKIDENKGTKRESRSPMSSPIFIILMILAIPIALPFVLGAIGVLIGVEVTIFALGIVSFVLTVASVMCLVAGISTLGASFMTGLFVIGLAIIIFGFAIIMGICVKFANKLVNVVLLGGIWDLMTTRKYERR